MKKTVMGIGILLFVVTTAWADPEPSLEIQGQGGMVAPISRSLHEYFNAAYSFGGAVGYKFNRNFSLLLDVDYNSLDSIGSGPDIPFSTLEVALLAKYRFMSLTSIRPYFLLGGGAAINNLSDAKTTSETDPLVKCGVGLEYVLAAQASIFLQGLMGIDLTSANMSPDHPTLYLPLQAGLNLSL